MRFSVLALSAVLLFADGVKALTLSPAAIYTPAVEVIPFLHSGNVLVQDFASGAYRLRRINVSTGTTTEVRNNLLSYLHPLDFGGSHAAWITYGTGGGSGPGGGIGGGGLVKEMVPGIPIPGTGSAKYYVKILTIGGTEQNATADTSYKEQLSIDNNAVVWTDYRYFAPGDTTIEIFYAVAGGAERRITTRKGYKSAPDIRGNLMVWQDYRNATSNKLNADIYLYNLSNNTERAICTDASYQDQPSVHGNYVVWQDFRNAGSNPKNADIYLFDLTTNQERAICTASGYQCNPRIHGNFVVWQDYRNATTDTANADIYLYDIQKGQEYAVSTKPGYQAHPTINDGVIVWYDHSDDKVYRAVISNTAAHIGMRQKSFSPSADRSLPIDGVPKGASVYTISGRANQSPHRATIRRKISSPVVVLPEASRD